MQSTSTVQPLEAFKQNDRLQKPQQNQLALKKHIKDPYININLRSSNQDITTYRAGSINLYPTIFTFEWRPFRFFSCALELFFVFSLCCVESAVLPSS